MKMFQDVRAAVSRSRKAEVVFLFVLALIVGVAVKVEASKYITMGYQDYTIAQTENGGGYNYTDMAKRVSEDQGSAAVNIGGVGGSCGQ